MLSVISVKLPVQYSNKVQLVLNFLSLLNDQFREGTVSDELDEYIMRERIDQVLLQDHAENEFKKRNSALLIM